MREQSQSEEPGQKPFAEFVREAPRHPGHTVTVTGRVTQSEQEGHFVLDLGGGQTLELPIEAVRDYKVIEGGGNLVTLDLPTSLFSGRKSIVKEAVQDLGKILQEGEGTHSTATQFNHDVPHPLTGGAVPFTLATGHHAPQQALGFQGLTGQNPGVAAKWTSDPLSDKPSYTDSHTIHDLLINPVSKHSFKPTKDPISDKAPYTDSYWIQDLLVNVFEREALTAY